MSARLEIKFLNGDALDQVELPKEVQQLFPLNPEAYETAKQLTPPGYIKGVIVAGNCSIELIGSSPFGRVDYGSPNVTLTWTQLPTLESRVIFADGTIRRGFGESMYAQLTEGVPGLHLDPENERVVADLETITKKQTAEVEHDFATIFGRQLVDGELAYQILSKYRISPTFAAGLYHLLMSDDGYPERAAAVKGQVTGVVSFGLKVVDKEGKPIIHHDKYDTVAKALMLKTAWQREILYHLTGNPNVRINADEPFLVQAWSQHLGVPEQTVIRLLRTQQAVIGDNGGVHCCGVTNYQALFESGTRVVELDLTGDEFDGNWDSANYAEKFVATAQEAGLPGFLNNGGILGLGIVPFDNRVAAQTIAEHGLRIVHELRKRGIDINPQQLLITPVCGAGSENVNDAMAGFNNLPIVSHLLQDEFSL